MVWTRHHVDPRHCSPQDIPTAQEHDFLPRIDLGQSSVPMLGPLPVLRPLPTEQDLVEPFTLHEERDSHQQPYTPHHYYSVGKAGT